MNLHIRVGQAVLKVEGVEYTRPQIRALLTAVTVADQRRAPDPPEESETLTLGFTTERLPEELADPPGHGDEIPATKGKRQ
jgi:hypothetical protein